MDFWTGASGTSGTLVLLVLLVLVFWYFWYFVKLGFHFSGDPSLEKVR
jgi:hypothetical protein